MDCPAQSIWQTFEQPGCHPFQVGYHDPKGRERPELARKRHPPNEQHGTFLLQFVDLILTHLPRLQSYKEQATKLAGQIGLLKMYSTKCAQQTATDAVQIFGGRGITRSVDHITCSFAMLT